MAYLDGHLFGGCSDCCLVECCIEGAFAFLRAGNEIAMCVRSSLPLCHLSALLLLPASVLSAGCSRSATPAQATPVSTALGRGAASPAIASSPEQKAIAHVHSYTLYQKAEIAYKANEHKKADVLLQQLAVLPELIVYREDVTPVRWHHSLCL